MWIIHVCDNESSNSSRVRSKCKNVYLQEHPLRGAQDIVTQKLILKQKHEIKQVSIVEWHVAPWVRSTLLNDRVTKLSKAKVHVYSDIVLCLGKMHPQPLVVGKWKEHLEYFRNSNEYKECFGIDGEPFEFDCNIFPGHTAVQIIQEIQFKWHTAESDPKNSKIGSSSYLRSTTSIGQRKFQWMFFELSEGLRLRKKSDGTLVFLSVLMRKKSGTERTTTNWKDNGTFPQMSVRWIDGSWERKGWTCSIHFDGDSSNA